MHLSFKSKQIDYGIKIILHCSTTIEIGQIGNMMPTKHATNKARITTIDLQKYLIFIMQQASQNHNK